MDWRAILRFLIPEYQIIHLINEHGFTARSNSKVASGTGGPRMRKAYASDVRIGPQAAMQAGYGHVTDPGYSDASGQTAGWAPGNQANPAGSPRGSYPGSQPGPITHTDHAATRTSGTSAVSEVSRAHEANASPNFELAREQLLKSIIGQRNFLDQLVIAFKRPFVSGHEANKPKNAIIVIGHESSGRRTCIETAAEIFARHNVLRSGRVSAVNLALYPTVSEQSLFLSDLYKALSSDSDIIVFNAPEKCHANHIGVLTNLVVDGVHHLQARYLMQNDMLTEATGLLTQNTVGELHAMGKYFIFVSELDEGKLMDVLGPKLWQALGDVLHVDPYSESELVSIADKLLRELKAGCESRMSISLHMDKLLVEFCAKQYNPATGIASISSCIDDIRKALTEYVLRSHVAPRTRVELNLMDGEPVAVIAGGVGRKAVRLREWMPKKAADPLLEVKRELDNVIGLQQVKEYVLDLERNLKIQKMRESAGLKKANITMHMIFTGNPGTGKTTIARIVAKYLKAIGVLSIGQLREVTRGDLVGKYVGHTAKLVQEVVQSALGGVLFIDEAYALCRNEHDTFGLEAIDTLVKAMEDHRDDLVVILAGYREEMMRFLELNSGLKSRFPNIIDFPDYSPEEMVEIALKTASSKGYRIADDCLEPLRRLFEKSQIRGRNDSGNGRLVRNVIEAAILEQSRRLTANPVPATEIDLLIPADFKFGQEEAFDLEQALSGIVGLDSVKSFIRTQYQMLIAEEKRRKAGIQTDTTQTLNMIFTGNPGTGKTTVARLMASMFREMGVLKSGHLVETDREGLVAEYVGQTAKKTEEVFRSALGGVLFIDEAYALNDGGSGFGKEAIDTLVKLMEDYRGEIAVILAGYKKEMAEFLKTNSGLQSRFPLQIEFPDYSADELYQIALKMIDAKGFRIVEEAKVVLREQLEWMRKTATEHSGNGRMVRNLVEKILRNQSVRVALHDVPESELTTILPVDLESGDAPRPEGGTFDLEQVLSGIVGLDDVKQFVRSLYARLRIQSERKKLGLPVDSAQTLHMIFKGNPGTGKTMVARIIADVLYNIGVIRTNKLVETDRAGLVAGYVGQTAIKTTEKVREAMDGVLFIDEAYALSQGGPNDFGKEAIDTLVKLMDDNRERLVVILAGYSRDMDDFLKTNPGLKSRFPNIIEFADYTLDELMQIADGFYRQKGYVLSDAARSKLEAILGEALREEAFGNGRYVRNVFERSVNRQALRLSSDPDLTPEELMTIEADDIERV
jgi:SpoVK/Ycf46/Vps4 family AAA+-type ATPase